jgi:nucleoside-diphosphate-sugar epimerase
MNHDTSPKKHVLVTGAAGYIGSLLAAELLRLGYRVTGVDSLLFGGESLLGLLHHPDFHFTRADVTEPRAIRDSLARGWDSPQAIVHLAAIVGFPACQAVGRQAAWQYNVEATKLVFEQGAALGVERFVFASTYSNYGLAQDGKPVTEESQLNPQSLYAETKIAAEQYLMERPSAGPATVLFRFATLYGISPRPRLDLIVNQFVLDAFTRRELTIYQRGYSRSFIHVADTVRGIILGLEAPEGQVRGQIFNLGSDDGNYTKDEIVAFVIKRLPDTVVTYKDLTFGGDMRDITVSFEKVRRVLGFQPTLTVDDGVRELVYALRSGLIREPHHERYRNAQFIVQ